MAASATFQICDVRRPIFSAGKLTRAGFMGHLAGPNSHLEKQTVAGLRKTPLFLRGNSYYVKVRLPGRYGGARAPKGVPGRDLAPVLEVDSDDDEIYLPAPGEPRPGWTDSSAAMEDGPPAAVRNSDERKCFTRGG